MPSDKTYALEQMLYGANGGGAGAGLYPGLFTAFNPLSNGWAVNTGLGWSGAWVRYFPLFNMVFMVAMMTTGTTTDGTQIATIPATDSQGYNLRPAQIVPIPLATDVQRIATGSNNEGARLHLGSGGALTCFGVAAAATVAEVSGWYPLDPM
jgi:hypothetical protein